MKRLSERIADVLSENKFNTLNEVAKNLELDQTELWNIYYERWPLDKPYHPSINAAISLMTMLLFQGGMIRALEDLDEEDIEQQRFIAKVIKETNTVTCSRLGTLMDEMHSQFYELGALENKDTPSIFVDIDDASKKLIESPLSNLKKCCEQLPRLVILFEPVLYVIECGKCQNKRTGETLEIALKEWNYQQW